MSTSINIDDLGWILVGVAGVALLMVFGYAIYRLIKRCRKKEGLYKPLL